MSGTLAVAILGVALAAASLAWQIVTARREGPLVKVTIKFAFLTLGPELSDELINVVAANVGRSPVVITGWSLDAGGDQRLFMPINVPGSTPLPHTLHGGHHANFFIELDRARAALAEKGARRTRGFVHLGSGKDARSRWVKLKPKGN